MKTRLLFAAATILPLSVGVASEEGELRSDLPSDPAALAGVPEAVVSADFDALVKTSPFTRVLNLAETYSLRGVATIDNRQVATLYNRETKKTIVVTPEGNNEAGISLVDVSSAPQLDAVTAKISFAGDEAELRYETSQLYPEPKAQPGRPGQPSKGEPRGPSAQDIARFKALPEEKQAKLRDYIGHVLRNHSNLSREERGNLIRGAMIRLSDGRDLEIPAAPAGGSTNPASERSGAAPSNSGNANRGGESRSRGGDSRDRNRGGDRGRGR